MNIYDILEKTQNWTKAKPAKEEDIQNFLNECPVEIDNDFIDFLKISNGGDGELPINPYWFQIWPIEENLKNNRDYEVKTNVPDFIGIGSNGAGELLAFKIVDGKTEGIYAIPFVLMDGNDAELITPNFVSLVRLFGKAAKDVGSVE